MKTICVDVARRTRRSLGLVAAVFGLMVALNALSSLANETAPAGRLDFEAAKLPTANLEVDLSQETFQSLFGIGDAAIAGITDELSKSEEGEAIKKQLTAQQLDAVRKIAELGGKFIREVRVRAYESLPEGADDVDTMLKPVDAQLRVAKWETVVRLRSDDDMVRVSVLQKEGSIRGIFVAASSDDGIAVANIVCDISPDNVKPLTAAMTKIGMSREFQPIVKWTISQVADSGESNAEVAPQRAAASTAAPATAAAPLADKVKK
jgi:hypothetical protein